MPDTPEFRSWRDDRTEARVSSVELEAREQAPREFCGGCGEECYYEEGHGFRTVASNSRDCRDRTTHEEWIGYA